MLSFMSSSFSLKISTSETWSARIQHGIGTLDESLGQGLEPGIQRGGRKGGRGQREDGDAGNNVEVIVEFSQPPRLPVSPSQAARPLPPSPPQTAAYNAPLTLAFFHHPVDPAHPPVSHIALSGLVTSPTASCPGPDPPPDTQPNTHGGRQGECHTNSGRAHPNILPNPPQNKTQNHKPGKPQAARDAQHHSLTGGQVAHLLGTQLLEGLVRRHRRCRCVVQPRGARGTRRPSGGCGGSWMERRAGGETESQPCRRSAGRSHGEGAGVGRECETVCRR